MNGRISNRDNPGFIALACDSDFFFFQIDPAGRTISGVFDGMDIKTGQFGYAQTTGIKQLEHGVIA